LSELLLKPLDKVVEEVELLLEEYIDLDNQVVVAEVQY
jgi:hypothetical protein